MIKRGVRKLLVNDVFAEQKSKKNITKVEKEQEEKKQPKVQLNYVNVLPPIEIKIADKTKLVISVTQASQDSPAHVDIRTHIESDNYIGPTKKGINFNIEYIDELIEILQGVSSDCEDLGV